MNCFICKLGETRPGTVTVTLERDGTTFVLKNVPAQVCENCGEAYVDEATTEQLLIAAQAAVSAGVKVQVREFAAGNMRHDYFYDSPRTQTAILVSSGYQDAGLC